MTYDATKLRRAPVQPSRGVPFPTSVAWHFHERAWSQYAACFGRSQSAERIAERGGFSAMELVMFMLGKDPGSGRPTDAEIAAVRAEVEAYDSELTAARADVDRLTRERDELLTDWKEVDALPAVRAAFEPGMKLVDAVSTALADIHYAEGTPLFDAEIAKQEAEEERDEANARADAAESENARLRKMLDDVTGRAYGDDAYIVGLHERIVDLEKRARLADAITSNNATTAELLARADAAEAETARLREVGASAFHLGMVRVTDPEEQP